MMAAGVPAGANMAYTAVDSYPGSPVAVTVGKPGMTGEGWLVVTANALRRPALICGITLPGVANSICTSPPVSPAILRPPFL